MKRNANDEVEVAEEEEPFLELYASTSESWASLTKVKKRLAGAPESVWKSRDLPSANFAEQFKGCFREL